MASSSDKPSRQAVPWLRIGAEGSAIVLSILLAFAIDAWWQGRQDDRDEYLVLEDLSQELAENVQAIDQRWLPTQVRTATGTARVLRLLHGIDGDMHVPEFHEGERWSPDAFRSWYINEVIVPISESTDVRDPVAVPASIMAEVASTQTYGPSLASLEILMQAGALASLSDRTLRSRLAALPAELDDLTDEELLVRDFFYREVYPRLSASGGSMTVVDLIGDGSIGGVSPPEGATSATLMLQGSTELSRALAKRLDLQVNVVVGVNNVANRFREILSLIQAS
jgi:hypothetical protein